MTASTARVTPGLLIGITLGALTFGTLLYLHYKNKEHEAYLRWRDEVLKSNPESVLPPWAPWEFQPGTGPSPQSFYL